jgi:hypothetical protein
VARRRARSCRTVARSAPSSPRPSAARLSEMWATALLSLRGHRPTAAQHRNETLCATTEPADPGDRSMKSALLACLRWRPIRSGIEKRHAVVGA